MLYRTIENDANFRLRRDRRSSRQLNEFPIEDLNGNIIIEERRVTPDRRSEGMKVTESKISQKDFQAYFDEYQKGS